VTQGASGRDAGRPALVVVGATGAVGTVLLSLLSTRADVWGEIRLVSSPGSAGRVLKVRGEEVTVQRLTSSAFDGVDVAIFATPVEVARHWVPPVAERGVVVIDVSPAFRGAEGVPLVVPDVNPLRLRDRPRGIVAVPGCTTLAMVDTLAALHRGWGLCSLVVTSCQAASSAGRAGVERLYDELSVVATTRTLGQRAGDLRAALADALPASTSPFPAPLALNLVPFSGAAAAGGWSSDEMSVRQETRAVLGVDDLAMSVTCVQVPVVTSHSVAVHATFQRPITPAAARRAIIEAPSIVLLDGDSDGDGGGGSAADGDLPTPADVVGSDPTWVGRVRQATDFPHSLDLVMCGDNLRRGSALTAVEVGELLVAELPRGPEQRVP